MRRHGVVTFNHRVAGWFLLFWGLTVLIAGLQGPRLTWWRHVPPMVLFGLAEFLFFRNDPEAWPVGPISFWASLRDPEDLQHRIFLLLVILITLVELVRAAGRLSNLMAQYALPALACFGAIYLFFHKHHGAGMAELMRRAGQPGGAGSPAVQQMLASMSLVRHFDFWFWLGDRQAGCGYRTSEGPLGRKPLVGVCHPVGRLHDRIRGMTVPPPSDGSCAHDLCPSPSALQCCRVGVAFGGTIGFARREVDNLADGTRLYRTCPALRCTTGTSA